MDREILYPQLLKDISGIFVEVGTCWGGFAEMLCKQTAFTQLFCVDPYKVFPQFVYQDALNCQTQESLDKKYTTVCHRLAQTKRPVTMVRLTSYEASKRLPNNLAFVYIDGNHAYKEVLSDLINWWPKIKKGGYLCGDDVEDIKQPHSEGDLFVRHQGGPFGLYGVATALQDFAKLVPDFQYQILGNQFIARRV